MIERIASGVAGSLFELVDELFTSDEERANAKRKLLELEQKGQLAQIAVNLQEARAETVFVAGWRPFIGWVCGAAFAYAFVVQPFLVFVAQTHATFSGTQILDPLLLPDLDLGEMLPVLLGMLGLSGLRTAEKIKGANKRR